MAQQLSAAEERDSQAKSIEETVETLRTENARLRDEATSLQQSRTEARKRISELEEALELAEARREQAEANGRILEAEREQAHHRTELDRLRAVAEETRKWEEREARLVQRIEELELVRSAAAVPGGVGGGVGGTPEGKEGEASETAGTKPAAVPMERSRYVLSTTSGGGREVTNTYHRDKPGNGCDRRGIDWGRGGIGESEGSVVGGRKSTGGGGTERGIVRWDVSAEAFTPHVEHSSPPNTRGLPPDCHPLSTGISPSTALPRPGGELRPLPGVHGEAAGPVPYPAVATLDALLMTLLAQQLPPLPNFSGEHMDGDGETFEEWLERLELVAATCRWDDQTKLVNIATRLRGSASRFYRTCTPQQRSNYTSLTTTMKQRFTPVRIQAVQSSRFHEEAGS